MSTTGLNGLTTVAGKTAQATTAVMYSQMDVLSLITLAGGEGTLSTCFTLLVSIATHALVGVILQTLYSLCTQLNCQGCFTKSPLKDSPLLSGNTKLIPHFSREAIRYLV